MVKKNMKKRGVIKLQRPVVTNDPNPQVLAYNKDRSIETFFPINDEMLALFGDEFKVYYWYAVDGKDIVLGDQVKGQRW